MENYDFGISVMFPRARLCIAAAVYLRARRSRDIVYMKRERAHYERDDDDDENGSEEKEQNSRGLESGATQKRSQNVEI